MLDSIGEVLRVLLGLGKNIGSVNSGEMALRSILVYAAMLLIIRLGSKRFLGKGTVFDTILGIMIGSVMSRAINGSAPFVPTLVAGAVLVAMHWGLAVLAYHFDWFGPLVKGNSVLLVKDGVVQRQGMRKGSITPNDLAEAMRMRGRPPEVSTIEMAYLEREGTISVVPEQSGPRIVEVAVLDGVQTVRIALE